MKRTPLQWLVAYAAIPCAMALITAGLAVAHTNREIDAYGYATLANAYPSLKPAVQAQVREAMHDGHLTQRQYDRLLPIIVNDNGMLAMAGTIAGADDARRAQAHYRAALIAAVQGGTTPGTHP